MAAVERRLGWHPACYIGGMGRIHHALSLVLLAGTFLPPAGLAFTTLTACGGCHPATAQSNDTRVYECPMLCVAPGQTHPYQHTGPGDCVVCGMHLVLAAAQPGPPRR